LTQTWGQRKKRKGEGEERRKGKRKGREERTTEQRSQRRRWSPLDRRHSRFRTQRSQPSRQCPVPA
jgi:hypothetical protein